ncbi:Ger(x)C family spore germination protein [Fictibacillus sp. 18YEL24]|uniref:Ger(x)C family spore germination protein n=1 Tax=Fictibacillus sp. 18YEL24 TaxID=2745875 RepID=UPI0018CF3ACB|nr:Ger(x)C family spore germination protein [Fictibacillus sp. 18YEL24]MBH0169587.1 Ger(x)C family spore germination protein [Fictibacillus sp. 18YEL24]
MKKKYRLCILFLIFILAGCVPKEIIDEVQLIHAIGFDKKPDESIQGTITYPVFNMDGNVRVETLTAVSHTSRFIRSKLNTQSPKTLTTGQLRVVLFNDRFAEKGIIEIVNSLYRDPNVGNRLFLTVVNGSTNELLTKKYTASALPSMYLADLLDQNIKSENLPKTNLHVFLYSYYGEGMDPFLPIVKTHKKSIQLEGIALFNKDKYVGKLNHRQSFAFKVLLGGSKSGNYEVEVKKEKRKGHAVIRNIKGTTTYDIKKVNGVPQFNIKMKILGEIHEYPHWLNLEQPANIALIEKTLKKQLQDEAQGIVKKFQKLKVDPLGLGDQVRRREKGWDYQVFKKQYPSMKIKVSTEVDVVETGVIE